MDRRAFLRQALFGLAAVSLPGVAVAALPPAFLFHPLGPDADLGLGWRLARVFPPHEGAITLNLSHHDGRSARVDVCLRDGAARGPAHTALLDFLVMDGGDGRSTTDESLGRVVRRLARIAADNEAADLDRIAALVPHTQRLWAHPDSMAAASVRLSPGAPAA